MYSPTFTDLLTVEGVEEMERKGYWIYYSTVIPNDLTRAVEDSVGRAELYRHTQGDYTQPESAPVKYFDSAKRPHDVRELWRKFIQNGINLPILLLSQFETANEDKLRRQGPIIVPLSGQGSPLGSPGSLLKSHPCLDGISIWRPIGRDLGPENGLFKVYPGSQGITPEEAREAGIVAEEIRVRVDQVLVTKLVVEPVESGGGVVMWMGFSTELIGLHAAKDNLEFIAGAYYFDSLIG
ncbi:hypothetical protein BJX62DRAFT_82528 [Aspergillus germanicus]